MKIPFRVLVCFFTTVTALSQTPRPLPTPATPAESALWREQGRTLPPPELLQPTLDSALPAYAPRRGVAISGHLKGAASDVLAALAKNWIAAFQKRHPQVVIELPPPYAGSLGAITRHTIA